PELPIRLTVPPKHFTITCFLFEGALFGSADYLPLGGLKTGCLKGRIKLNMKYNVSAVMAVRNGESTISQALASVLCQTLPVKDAIVCDDASTDATQAALAKLNDPHVRVIRNLSNIGPGQSRDKALRNSSSQWIALIDADDAWHPERLKHLLAAAETFGADVIFDDTLLCHDASGQ